MRLIDADALIEFCAERWIPLNIDAVNMQPTIQPENAQLSKEGTTSDLISRQQALNALIYAVKNVGILDADDIRTVFKALPTIQPEQCGDKSYTLWKESYEELKRRMDELTSCSDIISRQQALDAVGKYASVWMEYTDAMSKDEIAQIALNNAKSTMIRILKELPTIQPEPHEGHWIGSDGSYICSECNGSPIDFIETMGDSFDAYMETPMPYCPNCGVKMTISK